MYALIGLAGFFGLFVFLIRLIIHAVKKTPMKSDKAGMLLCVFLFGAGVAMTPESTDSDNARQALDKPDESVMHVDVPNKSNTPKTPEPPADQSTDKSISVPDVSEPQEPAVSSPAQFLPPDPQPDLVESQEPELQPDPVEPQKPQEPHPASDNEPSGGGNGNADNFNTYDNSAQQDTEDKWVLNTSTMKIHYPSCNQVKKIAPQNYSTSNEDKDSLIARGYSMCGRCG